jgi:hypothetical protein
MDMQDVDMDLDSEHPTDTLGKLDNSHEENKPSSIWSMEAENHESIDEETEKDEHEEDPKHTEDKTGFFRSVKSPDTLHDEDELEKPSFLRRFKRNKTDKSQEKTEEK